jgi:ethanolamine ammonia-lyase large subunit
LEWKLRKKFEEMEFNDIYELGVRAFRYEILLRNEVEKKVAIYRTCHKKTVDVDVAKFINNDPIVYDALTKKNVKSLRSLRSNKERHYSFDINQTDVIFY